MRILCGRSWYDDLVVSRFVGSLRGNRMARRDCILLPKSPNVDMICFYLKQCSISFRLQDLIFRLSLRDCGNEGAVIESVLVKLLPQVLLKSSFIAGEQHYCYSMYTEVLKHLAIN